MGRPRRSPWVRLLAYARPYAGLLALALFFSLLYAGGRNLRAYLIKPILDEVLVAPAPGEPRGLERFKPPSFGALLSRGLPSAIPGLGSRKAEARARAGGPARLESSAHPQGSREPPPASARPLTVSERFWGVLAAGMLVVLVVPLANFAKEYLAQYALGRILVDLQQALCAKLLVLPLATHHRMRRGETLTRTLNDVLLAHGVLKLLFGNVLQALVSVVVGGVVLFAISWQLTLVTLALAPVLVGVIAIFGGRVRRTAKRRQEKLGDLTQRLVEILSGIKVIKAFSAERHEAAAFGRENRRLFRRSMRVVKNRVLLRSLVEGLNNAIGIGILALGTLLVLSGKWGLSQGDLAAFAFVLATTYRPTKDLTKGWTQLMDALPSAERFFELLDHHAEPPDPPDAIRLSGVREGIRFADVHFSYGREPVLRGVSLEVKAGEVVGIVGRTGVGKSTLVDLLLRFHDPQRGRIEIDGIDLRRVARESLLAQIAVVTQDAILFDGTIRENIRYGRPDASDAEVEAAARAAHVDEFATQLPEGYDTPVGEAGVRLSGGQRQRITIARALLRDPAILVLDEATSALDAKSEQLVQDALERLLEGRTVFVIAHRLSTLRRVDKIVVLEDGRVSSIGSHEDLRRRPGLYRELLALQEAPAG